MPAKAKWTVLTYIAAHNNLEQFGKTSLMEILGVGTTTAVVQGALYDGPAGAGRYIMGEPGFVDRQEQLGKFDSGDPEGLIGAAIWLFEHHPAERYGLVLWSHGSGWEPGELQAVAREARPHEEAETAESRERSGTPGSHALFRTTLRSLLTPEKPTERAVLFDDGTGHSLDTIELAQVAGRIAEAVGQPLELLGMDACLMANLEVAYEVRRAARFLVASEELVPGHSWPYHRIFKALQAKPEQDGAEFGRSIVKDYVDYYTADPPPGGDVTKVAVDLGRTVEIAQALKELAEVLVGRIDAQADLLWKAQRDAFQRETRQRMRTDHKFNYHLWDIGTLVQGLANETQDPAVKTAAVSVIELLRSGAGAVLAEGHLGEWFDGLAGLSVYLVSPPIRVSPEYARLAFSKDTGWDKLLEAYHRFYT